MKNMAGVTNKKSSTSTNDFIFCVRRDRTRKTEKRKTSRYRIKEFSRSGRGSDPGSVYYHLPEGLCSATAPNLAIECWCRLLFY